MLREEGGGKAGPTGPALIFSSDGWAAFVGAVRDGRISS